MRLPKVALVVPALVIGVACGRVEEQTASDAVRPAADAFDPARDPSGDLARAVTEAQESGRRIMLDVGGEWCSWCHIMDAFIEAYPELGSAIARNYVWVKVNFSPENENEAFLSQYPEISGYPHLFVLDADGTLLHSQNTVELEEGNSYSLDAFQSFVSRWAPGS